MILAERAALALALLAIVQEEGGNPARVIVGQPGDSSVEHDLLAIVASDAFVALEPVAGHDAMSADRQAVQIAALVEAGYGDQILLSLGMTSGSARRSVGDDAGWASVLERFPLRLMEAGLAAAAVRRLLVENPARALTIATEDR